MIDEIKKSANSVFSERISSPFWGALICSWSIWNWRIVYVTFIIDQDKIPGTKIDYILNNFSDINYTVTYPLISTLLLLTLVPFLTNGAFWLSLKFQQWRSEQKNAIEKKQLLTLEQSIQLREEIINQEKRFDSLLESKNLEIKQLKEIINEAKISEATSQIEPVVTNNDDSNELALKITENIELKAAFNLLIRYIQSGWAISEDEISSTVLSFFIANNIIENKSSRTYSFTEKGKKILRIYTSKSF